MLTSNKKVATNTSVKMELRHIAGTSACLRFIIKVLVQLRKIAPAKMLVLLLQPHSRACSPQRYPQAATVLLETRVTGTATAWKRSIRVKTLPMRMRLDTRKDFADCMMSDIFHSVRLGRNG